MTNEMMIFEGHIVEIIEVNGDVLFNPKNVVECLDIEFKTAQNHMSLMNEKQVIKVTNEMVLLSRLTGFRILHNTGENFLTESGVYKLIFKSRKPEAEKFQDWVTDTVLPAIRKTGSYTLMPQSFPEALRLYANELEMKELVIKQRDEAIRTKAQIGSKREATSMATASVVSKANERLKEQIGDSKRYKAVSAIPWLGEVFDLRIPYIYSSIGKQLSKLSRALGRVCKKIEDSKYGEVKAYDTSVIEHFKFKLAEDMNMMRQFRKMSF